MTAMVVSGGHTNLYHVRSFGEFELLEKTRDDAAGEAFDKAAKMLGLGFPGGPIIDRLAAKGDPARVKFPRPIQTKGDGFSFSGLKTSLKYYLHRFGTLSPDHLADVAASYQQAIVDVEKYVA